MKVELQHITSVVDTRGLTWGENLAGSSGLGSYHKSHPWREKKNHSSTVGKFTGIIKIFHAHIFCLVIKFELD